MAAAHANATARLRSRYSTQLSEEAQAKDAVRNREECNAVALLEREATQRRRLAAEGLHRDAARAVVCGHEQQRRASQRDANHPKDDQARRCRRGRHAASARHAATAGARDGA
jgi:hypothetical protein